MVKKSLLEIGGFQLFWRKMLSIRLGIYEATKILFTLWEIEFSSWVQGACCYQKVMSIFVPFFQAMGSIVITLVSGFLNLFMFCGHNQYDFIKSFF